MTIDGDTLENLLWAEGIDTTLVEEDEDTTFLCLPAHNLKIGYAWNDPDSGSSNWCLDIGDIVLYDGDSIHGHSGAETAEQLVSEILEMVGINDTPQRYSSRVN